MKRNILHHVWRESLCLLSAAFLPMFAQANNGSTLTLQQAIRIGVEQNTSILQTQYNVRASEAAVSAAYGNLLPNVNVSMGWNRNQVDRRFTYIPNVGYLPIPSKSITNSYTAGASSSLLLFNGFANTAAVSRAAANSLASQYTLERTKQAVVYQVQAAYLNVLRTEQLVRVNAENLTRDSVQLVRSQEANRVGSVAIADVYRWEVQVANDQYNLVQAQNNYAKAKADLLALLSLDVTANYTIFDSSIVIDIDTSEFAATNARYRDFSRLYEEALSNRPDYKGAIESVNAASSSVTIARSGYFPSVSAFVQQGLNSDIFSITGLTDNRSLFWGLSIQWSLFDRLQTNNQIQSAKASLGIAEEQLAQTQRQIQSDLKKALLDLDAAEKQYVASVKGVQSASLDRKTAEERYILGAGTILDLTTANANYVLALTNKINAAYTYIDAKNKLDFVLGINHY